MTAQDIVGAIVLAYAITVCGMELALSFALWQATAQKAEACRERPSSLPAVRK